MSEPFLAEIRMIGFNFAPRGWAFCNGQILPINQNQALFSLLGTTYGGDGRTSFALPDLRGRTPIHESTSHPLGQQDGTETHTLTVQEMPNHTHTVQASSQVPNAESAVNNVWAKSAVNPHTTGTTNTTLFNTLQTTGVGQAHDNMQPFLTLNFCIALQGLFPSRS